MFPNLVQAMRARRYRQGDLAACLKMSEPSFSRRMSGKANFSPHELTRLSELLKVPARWLFEKAELPRATATIESSGSNGTGELRPGLVVELRQIIANGDPCMLLKRLYERADPSYAAACRFTTDALRRRLGVSPRLKTVHFWIQYHRGRDCPQGCFLLSANPGKRPDVDTIGTVGSANFHPVMEVKQ